MPMLTEEDREIVETLRGTYPADYWDTHHLIAIIDRLQRADVVLAEAERLLREKRVHTVRLHGDGVSLDTGHVTGSDDATLADAYAALKDQP